MENMEAPLDGIDTLTLPRRAFPVILRDQDNVVGFLTAREDFGFLKMYSLRSGDMVFVIDTSDDRLMKKLDRLCRHWVKLNINKDE